MKVGMSARLKRDHCQNFDIEFNSEDEDEEIDEDLAFTEEDKNQFSNLFHQEEPGIGSELVAITNQSDEVDVMFGSDDELEEITNSEDDETADVSLLQSTLQKKREKSQVLRSTVHSESRAENVLNMPVKQIDDGNVEQISSLTKGVGGELQSMWKGIRKSLETLEKQTPLPAPLPKRIEERQTRKAGYAHAVEDLTKWDDLVYANRIAPTIEFDAPDRGSQHSKTLEDLVECFEPQSQMEIEIAAMLEASGLASEEKIVEMEDEHALQSMSLADLKEKRAQLAKMRSLLFEHEIKAKHIKKIKSKAYHRRLQRSIRRKAVKLGGLNSDEAARKMLEEMSYNRTKERLTQKHSTMNRFARRVMRRGWGVADEETKQALEEQLRQSQELKQKMKSIEAKSSDDETSSDETDGDDEDRDRTKTRKALLKVLEGSSGIEEVPKKGLIALPFMQRSIKKRREETRETANRMLEELDGNIEAKDGSPAKTRLKFGNKEAQSQTVSSDSEQEDAKRVAKNLDKIRSGEQDPPTACHSTIAQPSETENSQSLNCRNNKTSTAHDFHFRHRNETSDAIVNKNDIDEELTDSITYQFAAPTIEISTNTSVEKEAGIQKTSANDKNGERTDQIGQLSQAELVEMAFADDDVTGDFEEEKVADVGQELPKTEEVTLLPGWGRWKDEQKEPKWMQEKRAKNERLKSRALSKRKDAKKPFVFISEKPNRHLDKYKISVTPHTFTSAEEYKQSLRRPIGPDINTASAFDDFIRPKVLRRKGVIIQPLKLSHGAKEIREQVRETKEGNVKVRKIVGGEVKAQKRHRNATN